MASKREHDIAVAIAQEHLRLEMQQPDYMDLGAGVSAASFELYYTEALEQLEGDFPDSPLD
ncbi:hypothetical protein ACFC3A_12470 [Enterococcus thailandicus]|uniref:hypothetical protein n=1 Tax=Enterococcus thailandicus TaxID=417368 RepID=UPI0039A5519B